MTKPKTKAALMFRAQFEEQRATRAVDRAVALAALLQTARELIQLHWNGRPDSARDSQFLRRSADFGEDLLAAHAGETEKRIRQDERLKVLRELRRLRDEFDGDGKLFELLSEVKL